MTYRAAADAEALAAACRIDGLVALAGDAERVPAGLLSVSGMLFAAADDEVSRRFCNGTQIGMHVARH